MYRSLCTHCSYIYDPFSDGEYIPLESLESDWTCPHCGEWIGVFMEISEPIQEISRLSHATEQELLHIPHYSLMDGKITVTIGDEDEPHPTEDGHFLTWVGIFDSEGEVVDLRIRPPEATVVFDDEWLDEFEIRARCNLHGVWRGIRSTTISE